MVSKLEKTINYKQYSFSTKNNGYSTVKQVPYKNRNVRYLDSKNKSTKIIIIFTILLLSNDLTRFERGFMYTK